MVTYFNRKDLVSFGSYLLSEKRKANFEASYNESVKRGEKPISVEESLNLVHHADVENWIYEEKSE